MKKIGLPLVATLKAVMLGLPTAAQFKQVSAAAKEMDLYNDLMVLRIQLELYRVQHGDRYPWQLQAVGTDSKKVIEQLTHRTNEHGEVEPKGSPEEYKFGPYFENMPVNPFAKNGAVIRFVQPDDPVVLGKGKAGWIVEVKTNKVYANSKLATKEWEATMAKKLAEEIAKARREGANKVPALKSDLLTLRNQLELYRVQHRDKYPWQTLADDLSSDNVARRLTERTNEFGDVMPLGGDPKMYKYGPYFDNIPVNPFVKNGSAIRFVKPGERFRGGDGKAGWVVDMNTNQVYANTDASTHPEHGTF